MDKSEKTMDVLRQVVIISLSSVITGVHVGPVLAISAHHKLDGKQNVQAKFAQLGTYSFLESANLELTSFTNLELAKAPKLPDSSESFSASQSDIPFTLSKALKSLPLSKPGKLSSYFVTEQKVVKDHTVKNIGQIFPFTLPTKPAKSAEIAGASLSGDSVKFSSLTAITNDANAPSSSLKVFPINLNKPDKYPESFAKNLNIKNWSSDLLTPATDNLAVNKLAKPSIIQPIDLSTPAPNYLALNKLAKPSIIQPIENSANNLEENIILTGIDENLPIKTVRDIEKVNTQSSVLLNSDQGMSKTIAQADSETDANSYPPPVPNGTLQTNPPEGINPIPNPLYVPNTPAAVQLQGSVSLTLQQAIDIARRNNTSLRSSELELVKSRERVRQAQAALLPQLDLQSSTEWRQSANGDIQERAARKQARKQGVDYPEDNTQNIPNFTFDTSLSLSYDTGIDGARGARIRATEKEVLLRELEFERLTEEVRLQTSADYFELQESDGRVKIGDAAVANAKKSLSDAEALERAGVGTRFDVLQSQVKLANEQQNLTNALRDQRVARRRLAQTLNVAQTVELTAADPIEPAGSWRFSLDETIIQAFNNRAELEQQLVRRDLNDEERKIALSAMRPRLILFASYDVLFLAPNDNNVYLPRGWGDGYSVGARINWNIFDGGDARSRARQSELDKQLSEVAFEETRNDVRVQVERAFFELEASFENIGTAELGLEQAKEALRLARLRFQAGVGTQLEVINQETELTNSQISLLVAIINYNRSLSALQRAVSNLPDNNLSDSP
ncbi:MAG: TolC family protein [Microcoleaceae cyanobacterium]